MRRVKIHGKFWLLKFVPRLGGDKRGDCDSPEAKSKEIRILSKLRGEERLEVLIHEMLHASDWHRSEEWVAETSRDMARVIAQDGFTRRSS